MMWKKGATTRSSVMEHFFNDLVRYVNHMDAQEWVYVLAGMLIVGFVCMRGFGSRSSY
jgi:hypothetical protein